MKDKIKEIIRSVPITDKTYAEYVEGVAERLIAEDYRKIYDDHERQCICYALGCQMAEGLKRKAAKEIFKEIDALVEMLCAMTGLNIVIGGKYTALKKKYTEGKHNGNE